jgi:phospholipase/lecithinase/hemolysin
MSIAMLAAIALVFQATPGFTCVTTIVVFGDSLSDTGRVFAATNGSTPAPSTPGTWWNGRFSNGPLWIDYLTEASGVPNMNYAWGGAACMRTSASQPPTASEQYAMFVAENTGTNGKPIIKPKHRMAAMYIGGNDILSPDLFNYIQTGNMTGAYEKAAAISACIVSCVQTMLNSGEKNILLFNIGPIDRTPLILAAGPELAAVIKVLTKGINDAVKAAVPYLVKRPRQEVVTLNIYKHNVKSIVHAARYGFTNSTHACIGYSGTVSDPTTTLLSKCDNPDEYIFYDDVHQTTRSNNITFTRIYKKTRNLGWLQ